MDLPNPAINHQSVQNVHCVMGRPKEYDPILLEIKSVLQAGRRFTGAGLQKLASYKRYRHKKSFELSKMVTNRGYRFGLAWQFDEVVLVNAKDTTPNHARPAPVTIHHNLATDPIATSAAVQARSNSSITANKTPAPKESKVSPALVVNRNVRVTFAELHLKSSGESSSAVRNTVDDYFNEPAANLCAGANNRSPTLMNGEYLIEHDHRQHINVGYLGHRLRDAKLDSIEMVLNSDFARMFINVSDPFSMVAIGLPGAGKSHTMATVLENCMMQCPLPLSHPIQDNHGGMCGLVFHYDPNDSSACEVVCMDRIVQPLAGTGLKGIERVVILVPPTFYRQRKQFYGDKFLHVYPLLFNWNQLTASQLRKLMHLGANDAQLYVNVLLDLLRKYQREDALPPLDNFVEQVRGLCQGTQSGPLAQRLTLLQNMLKEYHGNADLVDLTRDLHEFMQPGTLLVCDWTDPMMTAEDANGIFQIVLEQFLSKPLLKCGKVVLFDEAHKYLEASTGSSRNSKDELSRAIIDLIRVRRHQGARVLISTQSPLALPSEVFEICSVAVLHQFQSEAWYNALRGLVALPVDGFDVVRRLQPGEALVACSNISDFDESDKPWLFMKMRKRLTVDLGESRTHDRSDTIHSAAAQTEATTTTTTTAAAADKDDCDVVVVDDDCNDDDDDDDLEEVSRSDRSLTGLDKQIDVSEAETAEKGLDEFSSSDLTFPGVVEQVDVAEAETAEKGLGEFSSSSLTL